MLLAAAYICFWTENDANRSAVHVAESLPEGDIKEDEGEERTVQDKAEEGSVQEKTRREKDDQVENAEKLKQEPRLQRLRNESRDGFTSLSPISTTQENTTFASGRSISSSASGNLRPTAKVAQISFASTPVASFAPSAVSSLDQSQSINMMASRGVGGNVNSYVWSNETLLPQSHSTELGGVDANLSQPESFAVVSGGSQANGKRLGSSLFRSCQARINIWNLILIDNSYVVKEKRLGQGAYAEVYEGRVRDRKCAIKLYRRTASQEHLKEAMREIRLAASLDHPCTLRLIGWVRQPLQTITELCLGDLKDFYNDKIEGLHYSEVRALMLLRVRFCSYRCEASWTDLPPALSLLSKTNLHYTYLTGERRGASVPPHCWHHSP